MEYRFSNQYKLSLPITFGFLAQFHSPNNWLRPRLALRTTKKPPAAGAVLPWIQRIIDFLRFARLDSVFQYAQWIKRKGFTSPLPSPLLPYISRIFLTTLKTLSKEVQIHKTCFNNSSVAKTQAAVSITHTHMHTYIHTYRKEKKNRWWERETGVIHTYSLRWQSGSKTGREDVFSKVSQCTQRGQINLLQKALKSMDVLISRSCDKWTTDG